MYFAMAKEVPTAEHALVVPATSIQGVRKVRNFTLDISAGYYEAGNASFPYTWVLQFVPQG